MPVNAASAPSAPTDLAWRVIGLLNLYRLLVPVVLMAVQALAGPQWALLATHPRLFLSACIAYLTAGILLIIARRLEWSSLRIVALVNSTEPPSGRISYNSALRSVSCTSIVSQSVSTGTPVTSIAAGKSSLGRADGFGRIPVEFRH